MVYAVARSKDHLEEGYEPDLDGDFKPNMINSVVFLVGAVQQVCLAALLESSDEKSVRVRLSKRSKVKHDIYGGRTEMEEVVQLSWCVYWLHPPGREGCNGRHERHHPLDFSARLTPITALNTRGLFPLRLACS